MNSPGLRLPSHGIVSVLHSHPPEGAFRVPPSQSACSPRCCGFGPGRRLAAVVRPERDGIWRRTGSSTNSPTAARSGSGRPRSGQGTQARPWLTAVSTSWTGWRPKSKGTRPAASAPRVRSACVCLDAKTGKEIWIHAYDCPYKRISYGFGPRTTPTVVGDRVYTLGTMGDLRCLDRKTGKPIWTEELRHRSEGPGPGLGLVVEPARGRRQDHLARRRGKAGGRRVRSQRRQGPLVGPHDGGGRVSPRRSSSRSAASGSSSSGTASRSTR